MPDASWAPPTQYVRGRADATAAPADDELESYSPSLILLVIIGVIGILLYAAFLLNPAVRGDGLPYTLVIIAETILITHGIFTMWTILSGLQGPRDYAFHNAKTTLFSRRPENLTDPTQWPMSLDGVPVTVDVFITVYGEDPETIRKTVTAAVAMKGAHTTWVLDDGKSDVIRDLAAELGARYVRRLSSGGAKAGNVNHALALTASPSGGNNASDFFVILDADFVPKPEFLVETVPFFADESVAFVQTPQVYGNLHNVISRGAGYMQTVFYRFIQPGRNRFNAAFCVGTNVIFRRAAVADVGGIYTDSKSEDVWTSLKLHERGWRSIFIPTKLAVGDAPDTIEAFAKQQLRWATGGFEILLKHNPLSPRRNLSLDQRLQYFVTATFYLTGIAPLLLLLVPPLEIYFDLRPITVTTTTATWFLYYAGFYVIQILVALFAMGSFRWETLMLAATSFPIYFAALRNAILGKEQHWSATGDKSKASSPFNFIVPQVLFFAFLALTSVVAIWRDVQNGEASLAMGWNVTNTLILGGLIVTAFREISARNVTTDVVRKPVEASA
jgi:cellulose synthase (UDP-forming)